MKRKLAYCGLTVLLVSSLIPFIQFFIKQQEEKELTSKMQSVVENENTETTSSQTSQMTFQEMKQANNDLVAILYIEGTDIYLPVVQTVDNAYYLNHNFYHSYSEYGCPFIDSVANADFTSRNTFIYGHNIFGSSGMFSFLKNYMNKPYQEQHPYIHLITEDKTYRAYVFSAYKANDDAESYQPNITDDISYQRYLDLITATSYYQTDLQPSVDEKIITLYTCSLDNITSISQLQANNARYYVHAILQEIDEEGS